MQQEKQHKRKRGGTISPFRGIHCSVQIGNRGHILGLTDKEDRGHFQSCRVKYDPSKGTKNLCLVTEIEDDGKVLQGGQALILTRGADYGMTVQAGSSTCGASGINKGVFKQEVGISSASRRRRSRGKTDESKPKVKVLKSGDSPSREEFGTPIAQAIEGKPPAEPAARPQAGPTRKPKEERRRYFVNADTNNVYVAFMSATGVVIKAVVLTHQDNRFWLVVQEQYAFEAFRDEDGNIVLPGFHEKHCPAPFLDLDEVKKFYGSVPDGERATLRPVSEYEPKELNTSELEKDELVVKLWTPRKGTGVGVLPDGREVGLFWRNVKMDFPRSLKTGVICRVGKVVEIPEKVRKQRKTDHEFEAQEVTLKE